MFTSRWNGIAMAILGIISCPELKGQQPYSSSETVSIHMELQGIMGVNLDGGTTVSGQRLNENGKNTPLEMEVTSNVPWDMYLESSVIYYEPLKETSQYADHFYNDNIFFPLPSYS